MDMSSFSPAMIIIVVVSLALAPFVAVMVTSFTKIVVVLSLLRNALGLQQVPPNVVINGLSIVLSIYIMYPVILDSLAAANGSPPVTVAAGAATTAPPNAAPPPDTAATQAASDADATPAANAAPAATAAQATTTPSTAKPGAPLVAGGRMDMNRLMGIVNAAKEPLRTFLIKNSHDAERAFFLRTAQRLLPPANQNAISQDDFIVVVPAFTVSELTAAFQIGFLIYLPFLVIDLVVSNILLALGMMMMSPTTVSLPFKLLLFVLIDGWARLVHGLVMTYAH